MSSEAPCSCPPPSASSIPLTPPLLLSPKEESSYWLRNKCERQSPLFFEEAEEIREIDRQEKITKEKKNDKEERRSEKKTSKREQRAEVIKAVIQYKIQEKLKVKARYPKRESLKIDLFGREDCEIVSQLFGGEEIFSTFSPSPPSLPLQHWKKQLIWRVKIFTEDQLGDWFSSFTKCYQMKHFAEVQFHNGVFTAPPTPMEVSLYYCVVTSWATSDILGEKEIESERKYSIGYHLKISFKISCSRISYESDSE